MESHSEWIVKLDEVRISPGIPSQVILAHAQVVIFWIVAFMSLVGPYFAIRKSGMKENKLGASLKLDEYLSLEVK